MTGGTHVKHYDRKGKHNSTNKTRNGSYKLYVSKIPVALNVETLKEVFKAVGTPTDVFLPIPNQGSRFKWGFVEYNSSTEADAAIASLNNVPPHHLDIKYASNRGGESQNYSSMANINRSRDQHQRSRGGDRMEEGSSSSDMNGEIPNGFHHGGKSAHNFSRERQNHRTQRPPQKHCSSFIKNIHLTVTDHGQRTAQAEFEEVKESSADDFDDTASVVGFTARLVSLGHCEVCSRDATKKCPACLTFYCSERCAAVDYKTHKTVCNRKDIPSAASSPRGDRNGDVCKYNGHQEKDLFEQNNRQSTYRKCQGTRRVSQQDRPEKIPINSSTSSLSAKEAQCTNLKKVAPVSKEHILSKSEFIKVNVTHMEEDGSLWVVRCSDRETAFSLNSQLQEICISNHSDVQHFHQTPQLNLICAALFSDSNEWSRAEVVDVKPLRVRYLDYGNKESISLKNLRTIPLKFAAIEALAFKIRLEKENHILLGEVDVATELSVQLIKADEDGALRVKVETPEDKVRINGVQSSLPCDTSCDAKTTELSPLPLNQFFKVSIAYRDDKEKMAYWVQNWDHLPQIINLLGSLQKSSEISPPLQLSDITVSHLYSATYECMWFRCEVLAVKPAVKVRFIDYGNEEICMPSKMRALPTHLSTIPPYAFKIKLASGTPDKYSELVDEDIISIKLVSKDEICWLAQVENESYEDYSHKNLDDGKTEKLVSSGVATLSLISPTITRDSYTPVLITHVAEGTGFLEGCWVMKVSDAESCDNLNMEVTKASLSSSAADLKSFEPGLTCAALFDGAWFRCVVLAVKPAIKVRFLDYGNEEICSPSEMRPLPSQFTTIPPYAFRIQLKRKNGIGESNRIQDGQIISIRLIEVNDNGCLVEEKNEADSSKEMSENVPTLPSPAVTCVENDPPIPFNTFATVVVAFSEGTPGVYWVYKKSDLSKIDKILTDVNNYCLSSSSACVVNPSVKQRVSALYENEWYRAEVISVKPELRVRFIDFGNEEICSADNLKDLPSELSSIPPLAFKLVLDKGTPDKYNNLEYGKNVSVCLVSKSNDESWLVHVEDENYVNSSSPKNISFNKEPDILNCSTDKVVSQTPFPKDVFTKLDNDIWSVHVENETYQKTTVILTPMTTDDKSSSGADKVNSHQSLRAAPNSSLQPQNQSRISPTNESSKIPVETSLKELKRTQQEPPVPKDKFTKVIVTYPASESCYWVMRTDKKQSAEEMFQNLNMRCSTCPQRIVEFESGMKCAAKYQHKWYRGRIVNLKPLQIKFVDFGDVEEVFASDVKLLPPGFGDIKPLAFKIKLIDTVSDSFRGLGPDNSLYIKPLNRDTDGSWLVSVNDNEDAFEEEELTAKISFKSRLELESPREVCAKSAPPEQALSPRLLHQPRSPTSSSLIEGTPHLPLATFTQVFVMVKNGEGDYWGNLSSSLKALSDMTEKLDQFKNQSVIPIIGKTYVHYYIDTWCRGKVVSLKPFTIFYLDYGNKEVIQPSELHPLPPEYSAVPPYAIRIKLAEGTSQHYLNLNLNSVLDVKPVSKGQDGVYLVHVKGEVYPTLPDRLSNTPTSKGEICVERNDGMADPMEVALNEGQCELRVTRVRSCRSVVCTVLTPGTPTSFYLDKITSRILNLEFSPSHRCQKVGEVIGCKVSENLVARGRVISPDNGTTISARVALIDYGYCCEPIATCELPTSIASLPSASVICKFKNPQSDLDRDHVLKCSSISKVNNGSDGLVQCEIYGRGKCCLVSWNVPNSLNLVKPCPLVSGTSVVLSCLTETSNSVYVQPIDKDNISNLHSVLLQMEPITLNGNARLNEEPSENDLVACSYSEDGKFYRAQIIEIIDNCYKINFIDFGNTSTVSFEDMKPLTEALKSKPACAVKVNIQGVVRSPITPELEFIIKNHIDSSTNFIITFNDVSCVDLVYNGHSLSDEVNKIINSSKALNKTSDPGVLMSDCLVSRFDGWTVGTPMDLTILSVLPGNFLSMVLKEDLRKINEITDQLTLTLTEYAASFPSNYTLRPLVNQLVVAQFKDDGLWYRAKCTQVIGSSFEVFFLDFGNIATSTESELRPMTEEHLTTPILVRKCRIHGLPESVSPSVQINLDALFEVCTTHKVIVSDLSSLPDHVTVYHPVLASKVNQGFLDLPPISPPEII